MFDLSASYGARHLLGLERAVDTFKVIDGTEGADILKGTTGDDVINALGGNDQVHGGQGDDQIDGGDGADQLYGNLGDDTLTGGLGNDVLHGGQGSDLLDGGDGDDVLFASKSAGVLTGEAGFDVIRFDESHAKHLVIDLDTGIAESSRGTYQFSGIEGIGGAISSVTVVGDDQNNLIVGSQSSDMLAGGLGDDTILSGRGLDTMVGGGGSDFLAGGTSRITFVYNDVVDSTVDAPDHINNLTKKDVFDFSEIDADTTLTGDQAFHLVESFSGEAGELITYYDATSDSVFLDGDVDGDGVADLRIVSDGHLSFDIKRFIL